MIGTPLGICCARAGSAEARSAQAASIATGRDARSVGRRLTGRACVLIPTGLRIASGLRGVPLGVRLGTRSGAVNVITLGPSGLARPRAILGPRSSYNF